MTKTIMLIHGAWLTPDAWSKFKQRYEAAGYNVVAPAWPMMDRPIADLRLNPDPALRKLSVGAIADHYEKLIRQMPEPPILMGHSFGGLIVQLLLDRGLGAAGVAIDPAVPRGVFPTSKALMSALPVLLSWMGWNRVLTMSFKSFAHDFANTLPPTEARAAYDRYIVPAPGRIYFQAALGIGIGVKFKNPKRPPLLILGGEKDRTAEPGMGRTAYKKHRKAPSPTHFHVFPGRSHWLCADRGWEEVADYSLDWACGVAAARAPAQLPSDKAGPAMTTFVARTA